MRAPGYADACLAGSDGGNVDNSSPFVFRHFPRRPLSAQKLTLEIDGEHFVPVFLRKQKRGLGEINAGIVDQNIQSAEFLDCFAKNTVYLPPFRNIQTKRRGLPAALFNFFDPHFTFFFIYIRHRHLGALPGERERVGLSHSAPSTSNESDLAY